MELWLVENFDPRSCTLKLQNGQTIHITADDVAAVLGLPKGNIEITKRTVKAMPEILKEWRWFFEKTTAYITPKALKRKMLEVDAANPWFKRHFALLVMSVLVDPMVNGYVTQNYIDHLLDIVPRSIPAIKNWTFKLLSKRERDEIKSGGFGYGSNTRTIATGLLKVARLVENAPTAILEDDRFKKMFETARQLLGFKAQEDQHLTFSQQEDAFWSNPEFLNAVDEIVRAVQKRTYLNDIPSFSLGLTQDEQTQRWDDVNAVAREYNECEQSKEGEENQVADDGALGDETAEGRKGSEDRPNEGEGAQAREAATTAQADEVMQLYIIIPHRK
nr:uncharacterized protein LOC109155335 [Ipomoea batatas]